MTNKPSKLYLFISSELFNKTYKLKQRTEIQWYWKNQLITIQHMALYFRLKDFCQSKF